MASKRKSTSKKIRFEVFKRDAFKCQYCGRPAPDVVLEVDHINPVSKGGTNEILNYITSCRECNSGKSDRTLSDNSTLQMQRKQLEELNERREQLKMMVAWREGLNNLLKDSVKAVEEEFYKHTGRTLTEIGRYDIKRLIEQYSVAEVLEAVSISASQYLEFEDGIKSTDASTETMYNKIKGICYVRKNGDDSKDVFYIRAILKNRMSYYDEARITATLFKYKKLGYDMKHLKEVAKEISCWSDLRNIFDPLDIWL